MSIYHDAAQKGLEALYGLAMTPSPERTSPQLADASWDATTHLLYRDVTDQQYEQLMYRFTHDLWRHPTLMTMCGTASLRRVQPNVRMDNYYPANPSILTRQDGTTLMSIRHMTYSIIPYMFHRFYFPPPGWCDNQNSFHVLDRDMVPCSGYVASDQSNKPAPFRSMWIGYEDLRLFEVQGILYANAVTNTHVANNSQQVLLRFNKSLDIDDVQLLDCPELQTRFSKEKNWMPILGDPFSFVRRLDPMEVVRYDPATKLCRLVYRADQAGYNMRRVRGGSQLIRYRDGYLCCIHEVSDAGQHQRVYLHRILYLNRDLVVQRTTNLFSFVQPLTIEFCCGMALRDNRLTLTFGCNDRMVYVAQVDADDVWKNMFDLKPNVIDCVAWQGPGTVPAPVAKPIEVVV